MAPPVDHASDFLPYQPDIHYLDRPPFHGSEAEREQRFEEMRRMAAGELDYRDVDHFLGVSWEHPGLLIGALENKTFLHLNALNVPNAGYLPQLPEGAIVEAPADIKDGCVEPVKGIILPEKTIEICLNQCRVAGMIAQAAVEGNRKIIDEIIETDRSITYKAAAALAMNRMLEAHADVLPQFS